jgi:tyrosinase
VISGGTQMFGGGVVQKLSDVQSFPVIAPGGLGFPISELVSVVDGPFCYVYE